MSRMLILLILGVLLVLLGVMGFVVNPRPKGPPTAAEIAKQQEMAKKSQDDEMKQRQKQMDVMIKAQRKFTAQKKLEEKAIAHGKQPPKEAAAPAPVPTMDISSDWFHKHPDGVKGLAKLEAVSKQQIDDDKKADSARMKMFTGGDVGPGLDKLKKHTAAQVP